MGWTCSYAGNWAWYSVTKRFVDDRANRATPTVPPIERKKVVADVTTPSLVGESVLYDQRYSGCAMPSPIPMTTIYIAVCQVGMSIVIVDSKNIPIAIMACPTTASILYLPVRLDLA